MSEQIIFKTKHTDFIYLCNKSQTDTDEHAFNS